MLKKMVCERFIVSGAIDIPFLYTVPAPPRDVVVERVNATHMEVRWTALSPVEARGHITHYTISYWPASNSEPVTSITVHNTTSTSYRVSAVWRGIYSRGLSQHSSRRWRQD